MQEAMPFSAAMHRIFNGDFTPLTNEVNRRVNSVRQGISNAVGEIGRAGNALFQGVRNFFN